MEFRKVGEELHLVDENNIPLFKFGEGYIKRYCLKFYYNTYKLYNEKKAPDTNNIIEEDLLSELTKFYGEEKGKFIVGLITNKLNLWKIENIYSCFSFPKDREFVLYTSDFVEEKDDIEIVQEEIKAKMSNSNHSVLLDKFPLAYSTYKLEEKKYDFSPILSNESIDLFLIGNEIKYNIKSFPLNYNFIVSGQKIYIDINHTSKYDLIKAINWCSLKEQLPVLMGGFKSLIRIEKRVYIPGDKLITRWSKHLGLSYSLRKLLISNNKIESYSFLKDYIECNNDSKKLILQLGEDYIKTLLKHSSSNFRYSIFRNISSSNIKFTRELISRYSLYYGGDIYILYREYLEKRKRLHEQTPIFPKDHHELLHYVGVFNNKIIILENQEPFPNLKGELEYEGETMITKIPICGGDLIKEGQDLHHCVGGYVNSVKEGRTNIVFIRRKEEPEKAFYTVELRDDNTLIQVRGLQNKAPTKEVSEFLKEYLKQLPSKS